MSPRGAASDGGGPGPPEYRLEGAESQGAEARLPHQDAGFGEEEEERGVMSARQGDQPRPVCPGLTGFRDIPCDNSEGFRLCLKLGKSQHSGTVLFR